MSKHVLKTVSESMELLGIEYGFAVYSNEPVVYPYFVGEYQETESITEDGLQEATFILTGFSRDSWISLENAKDTIENYFCKDGRVFTADDGSAAVLSYAQSLVIPKEDAELKSIQINLSVKEWKVN